MLIKPMKACKVSDTELALLKYPLFAQPKYDGIRCIVQNGVALSNTLKPIRNSYVQAAVANWIPDGFDGELIAGNNFQDTTSCIMSEGGDNQFTFFVFDIFNSNMVYSKRLKHLEDYFTYQHPHPNIVLVQAVRIRREDQLLSYEESMLEAGHEGIMLRSPDGLYKYGRSTLREQALLKRKPFLDAEGTILGFIEQEENQNDLTYDERGYAKRSAHGENKIGKNTLGAFIVATKQWGHIRIGTGLGLTNEVRQEIWDNQDRYNGRCITFKYQQHGTKDLPRTPIFLRFRHEDDLVVL